MLLSNLRFLVFEKHLYLLYLLYPSGLLVLQIRSASCHTRTLCGASTSYLLSEVLCRKHIAMVYIRQEQLPKLKEYKYSGVDKSLVSRYIMKPFYTNYVIDLFPMSMA